MYEGSHFVFGDLVTGLFDCGGGDTFLEYGLPADNTPPFNFSYVPYWEDHLQNWSRFYQVIALANLIKENVPNMSTSLFTSEAVKNNYIAQALFIRAYAYFYMVRVWGDPVYVGHTYNDVDYGNIEALARTDEDIVLDSCLADLKEAATYQDYAGGDYTAAVTANKGSNYALTAHIYEWMHNYDSAHYYCQQVINNGGYSLEPMSTYTNIWDGESSPESIFELSMLYNENDPNFKSGGDWAEAKFYFFATFLKGTVVENVKTSCWIAPTDQFNWLLYNSDTTLRNSDARLNAVWSKVSSSGDDPEGYMMTKYSNFEYQDASTQSYPYINNNLVMLRLSDIILLDAEALAYLGRLDEARSMLAQTEVRAGIDTYTTPTDAYSMIDEVVQERGRELAGEGTWFYDLIRTNATQEWLQAIGYPAARVTSAMKGYYWPLDMSTLFPYDNLLTQNPYWAANSVNQ
ncbi:MAG: RagB/SusD family nutrient uptake outer membrane protein [Chitinophagaceae bacterium]